MASQEHLSQLLADMDSAAWIRTWDSLAQLTYQVEAVAQTTLMTQWIWKTETLNKFFLNVRYNFLIYVNDGKVYPQLSLLFYKFPWCLPFLYNTPRRSIIKVRKIFGKLASDLFAHMLWAHRFAFVLALSSYFFRFFASDSSPSTFPRFCIFISYTPLWEQHDRWQEKVEVVIATLPSAFCTHLYNLPTLFQYNASWKLHFFHVWFLKQLTPQVRKT